MIARTTKPTMVARPTKPTMIARPTIASIPAPVVVAMPPIPVVAPAGVPKVAWAPLWERPGLGLSVSCPRTGDSLFASTYDQVVKNSFRIANRLDIVPALPPPDDYEHVLNPYELNPIRFLPLPPKVLVKFTPECEHSLATYLYLLSLQSGGTVIPLESTCQP
jgi:hypothetical protein